MPPVRVYENWTKRGISDQDKMEPYRKYYIICEGEKTEALYFKRLVDKRKELGIHSLIDIRFMEKTGDDAGLSHPKALIRFAEKQKSIESNAFDAGHDKMVIVFDADIFRGKAVEYTDMVSEAKLNNILGITYPCFELFLLLHFDQSYEEIIKPNAEELLRNKKIGNRRMMDKLFSDRSGMNPKSNPNIGTLVDRLDVALEQEKRVNQNIDFATDRLTSNIGMIIAQIRADEPK